MTRYSNELFEDTVLGIAATAVGTRKVITDQAFEPDQRIIVDDQVRTQRALTP